MLSRRLKSDVSLRFFSLRMLNGFDDDVTVPRDPLESILVRYPKGQGKDLLQYLQANEVFAFHITIALSLVVVSLHHIKQQW